MKEGQGGTVGAQRRSQICLPLPKILDPAHAQERGREWGSLNMGHPGSKSGDIRTRISGLPNQRTFREQEGSPQSRQHCTQIDHQQENLWVPTAQQHRCCWRAQSQLGAESASLETAHTYVCAHTHLHEDRHIRPSISPPPD